MENPHSQALNIVYQSRPHPSAQGVLSSPTAKERKRDAAESSMIEHPDKPGYYIEVVTKAFADALEHEAVKLRHEQRRMTVAEAIERYVPRHQRKAERRRNSS